MNTNLFHTVVVSLGTAGKKKVSAEKQYGPYAKNMKTAAG